MRNKAGRVPERLEDIKEALSNIKNDLGIMTETQFIADGKTQRAVIESIIVMGEAAKSIMSAAPDLENSAPELWGNFRDLLDMRNMLTHEYFRVDMGIVWFTVKNSIPNFEALLEQI